VIMLASLNFTEVISAKDTDGISKHRLSLNCRLSRVTTQLSGFVKYKIS